MYGSGMFIINPPWTLRAALEAALPWLVRQLGQDGKAGYTLADSSKPKAVEATHKPRHTAGMPPRPGATAGRRTPRTGPSRPRRNPSN